ncbi:peptidoglycan-binding protein [Streptomyces longisporoflavus]|uniref:Peptidoglycan-binding protein n=1 Tax=Streptomyces longisporoflavus TaxID=28044 RepID=A0ABW7R1Z0_9ACTN
MTTPDHTPGLRGPGGPEGDPAAALEVREPGALATEQPTGAELAASAPDPAEPAPVPAGGEGQDGADGGEEPTVSHRKRRPLRTTLIVLVAIAVAAAAGLAATGTLGGKDDDKPRASQGPSATAKVQRTSLTDTQTVDGNLSYGDASTVLAQSSGGGAKPGGGGGSGIVTWVPKVGDTIKRGGDVYRVNQQKTPLLYGNIPFYRTMQSGDSGSDVKILEQNLRALGYDGFIADSTYNEATAAAVKKWQDDLNREDTGTVKPGDAVVAPGARKVSAVKAEVGAAPSGNVLSWTGTERVITVDLDAQYEDLVKNGTKAQVELPDGTSVEATVTEVGSPSNAADEQSGDSGSGDSGDSDKASTLPVELKVKDQKGLGNYQAASVDVTLKSESRKDVLAVPVSALVAKDGGGYALEVVKSSAPNGVEYVPVKLGMFADSMVEVSGAGISEGTVVGVPK